jgi:hypothetical protein
MPLFPTSGPRPTSSEAERAFFRALLTNLPEGWTAWHSLRVRANATFEGESDFVLAVPDRAIVIVEVKGGRIECEGGQWLQNGRPMERAPREQAHRFRKALERKLRDAFTGALPPMLVVTAFPQTPFQVPPGHGDLESAVLGQQDMPWLRDALVALVDRQLGGTAPQRDQGWSKALHKLWGETWMPRVALGMRIKLREHELLPLDTDQVRLMEMLEHSTRLLVRGGPGTGKTLCARALCDRRAPALYLCWTRALAAAMRDSGLESAWAIREYAAHLLARAGVPIQDGAPPDEWSTETWSDIALTAAIDALPAERRHEIVVVDEAQDFTDNDWELARAVAGDGALWAFGDGGQAFWADRTIPAKLFPAAFELKARYRCPEPLAAFADAYRGESGGATAPSRCAELRVVKVGDGEPLLERLKHEVTRAVRDGAKPEDIAILSLQGQTRSELLKQKTLGAVRLLRADAPDAADHVICDTFLRFKGLERPVVFVTELDAARSYDVRMHVALTRATLQATVVARPGEIEADPRLAALA